MLDENTHRAPVNESQNPREDIDLGHGTPEERNRFAQLKLREKVEKKKSSPKAAILAHCHQCLGYYHDGREDCQNTKCPLYSYMPFRKLEPDFEWCEYNPKRVGKHLETFNLELSERSAELLQGYRAKQS